MESRSFDFGVNSHVKHQSLACQFFLVSSFKWQTFKWTPTDCAWRQNQTPFWGHRHPGHTQIRSIFNLVRCNLIDCLRFLRAVYSLSTNKPMNAPPGTSVSSFTCYIYRPMSECITFPSALACVQHPVHFFDLLCLPPLQMSQGIVGEFLAPVKTTEKISVWSIIHETCHFWAWIQSTYPLCNNYAI